MNEPTTSKGRGCIFYGCLTVVVLAVVITVAAVLTVRYAVSKVVDRFTDTNAVSLPTVTMATSEVAQLQERFSAFKEALRTGKPAEPLVLTELEVNALIGTDADLRDIQGKVYLTLAGDQIKGQISVPVDSVLPGRLKGRYLNGAAVFRVSLENGVLLVTLQSLEVKGEKVPDQVMKPLSQENLAKDVYRNTRTAEIIRRLESISVKDGKLSVVPREMPAPAQ